MILNPYILNIPKAFISKNFCFQKSFKKKRFAGWKMLIASAGNRTRAARVAGEHSTTEPPMLPFKNSDWM